MTAGSVALICLWCGSLLAPVVVDAVHVGRGADWIERAPGKKTTAKKTTAKKKPSATKTTADLTTKETLSVFSDHDTEGAAKLAAFNSTGRVTSVRLSDRDPEGGTPEKKHRLVVGVKCEADKALEEITDMLAVFERLRNVYTPDWINEQCSVLSSKGFPKTKSGRRKYASGIEWPVHFSEIVAAIKDGKTGNLNDAAKVRRFFYDSAQQCHTAVDWDNYGGQQVRHAADMSGYACTEFGDKFEHLYCSPGCDGESKESFCWNLNPPKSFVEDDLWKKFDEGVPDFDEKFSGLFKEGEEGKEGKEGRLPSLSWAAKQVIAHRIMTDIIWSSLVEACPDLRLELSTPSSQEDSGSSKEGEIHNERKHRPPSDVDGLRQLGKYTEMDIEHDKGPNIGVGGEPPAEIDSFEPLPTDSPGQIVAQAFADAFKSPPKTDPKTSATADPPAPASASAPATTDLKSF